MGFFLVSNKIKQLLLNKYFTNYRPKIPNEDVVSAVSVVAKNLLVGVLVKLVTVFLERFNFEVFILLEL